MPDSEVKVPEDLRELLRKVKSGSVAYIFEVKGSSEDEGRKRRRIARRREAARA
jgi:hypothetical protein